MEEELFKLVDFIYIDGRKDATMIVAEVKRKYYHQTTIEEHYVTVGARWFLPLTCYSRIWDW